MNISQQEQQALLSSKINEGKDEYIAKQEIYRDMKFIKDFNILKSQKEREIRELDREIVKRKYQIEKLKQESTKRLNDTLKAISIPVEHPYSGNNKSYANTTIIKRVMNYLKDNPSNCRDIKRIALDCCIGYSQADDAYSFINKYIRI
jgi:hypothetical protein